MTGEATSLESCPAKNGGVGMFSGDVSRAVNYVTMGLALAFIAAVPSVSMESMPVRVVDVQSVLRITIEATVGGLPTTIPVQLDGIGLIGPPDHALTKLKELCPPGCEVLIEVNGQRLETDAFGLAKAWILLNFSAPVDPASSPPAGQDARHQTSLQDELLRAGWTELEEPHSGRPFTFAAPHALANSGRGSSSAPYGGLFATPVSATWRRPSWSASWTAAIGGVALDGSRPTCASFQWSGEWFLAQLSINVFDLMHNTTVI